MASTTCFEQYRYQILAVVHCRQTDHIHSSKKKKNPVLVNKICSIQQARAWKAIYCSLSSQDFQADHLKFVHLKKKRGDGGNICNIIQIPVCCSFYLIELCKIPYTCRAFDTTHRTGNTFFCSCLFWNI